MTLTAVLSDKTHPAENFVSPVEMFRLLGLVGLSSPEKGGPHFGRKIYE